MTKDNSRGNFLDGIGRALMVGASGSLAGCTEVLEENQKDTSNPKQQTKTDSNHGSEDSVFVEEEETVVVGNEEEHYMFTVTNVENSSYADLQVNNRVPVEARESEEIGVLAYNLKTEEVVGPEEESLPGKPRGVRIGNLPESYRVCSYEKEKLEAGEFQTLTINETEYSIENLAVGENEGFVRIDGEIKNVDDSYEAELSGKEIEIYRKEGSNSTVKFEYGPNC